jgi:hypothetical protein
MIHMPSHPSLAPLVPRISRAPLDEKQRAKLAVSTLAIALLLVAAVVWLVAAYL